MESENIKANVIKNLVLCDMMEDEISSIFQVDLVDLNAIHEQRNHLEALIRGGMPTYVNNILGIIRNTQFPMSSLTTKVIPSMACDSRLNRYLHVEGVDTPLLFFKNPKQRQEYRASVVSTAHDISRTILHNYIVHLFEHSLREHRTNDKFLCHHFSMFSMLNHSDYDVGAFMSKLCKLNETLGRKVGSKQPMGFDSITRLSDVSNSTLYMADTHGLEQDGRRLGVTIDKFIKPGMLKSVVQRGECHHFSIYGHTSSSDASLFRRYVSGHNVGVSGTHRVYKLVDGVTHKSRTITMKDCLEHCFRFDSNGNLDESHSDGRIKNDMFKFDDGRCVAESWLDVDSWHIPPDVFDMVVSSLCVAVYGSGSRFFNALNSHEVNARLDSILPVRLECIRNDNTPNQASIEYYTNKLVRMDSQSRKVASAFLNSRICLKNLLSMMDHDICLPFDFLVFRPWIEYYSKSFVFLNNKQDATLEIKLSSYKCDIGEEHFNTSFDISYGFQRWNMDKTFFAENVETVLRGGCSTEFITREDLDDIRKHGGLSNCERSVMVSLVPCIKTKDLPRYIDIRGHHRMTPYCCYVGAQYTKYGLLNGIDETKLHDLGVGKTIDSLDMDEVKYHNTLCELTSSEGGLHHLCRISTE